MSLINCNTINLDEVDVRISELPKIINVKDEFIVTLYIENKSPYIFRRIKVNIELPYMMGIMEEKNIEISKILSGETFELKYHLLAVHGGRDFLKFNLIITELFDLRIQTYQTIIAVKGKGLYRGDNHTHSTRSDGQNNNSVFDNAKRVRETRALSWITPTDHCHINTEDANYINKEFDDFICVGNCAEYGMVGRPKTKGVYPVGKSGEHALQYNVNFVNNNLSNGRRWQDIVDEVNEQGGIFYIAHPFAPSIWWDEEEAKAINGAKGIEVWQGDYHALDIPNRLGFNLWDKMNSVGKHLFGLANSDGHFLHRLGHPFIMANLEELTRDEILNALKCGKYYGSNGPHLRFSINGSENGDTIHIENDTLVLFKIFIYDESPILNVKIYKNKISNNESLPDVYKEYNFENINEVIEEFYDIVSPNEYYRIEVITKEAVIGRGMYLGNFSGVGFAFSNPIWIELGKNKEFNDIDIDNVQYTKSGYPYCVNNNQFEIL